MLFNSYGFIFLYLPVVLLGFFLLMRANRAIAAGWLALASLFFYGYWNPAYVVLLIGSVVSNYMLGMWIAKSGVQHGQRHKKQLLIVAISANLMVLAYYKYANFFIGNVNNFAGTQWSFGKIILPLGISFFTFTQIAFLDLFMFNAAQKVNFSFDSSLVGRKVNIGDYVSTSLLSMDALADSISTIKTSHDQPERREFLSNGYRPGKFVFYKVKNYPKLHYYTNWTFLSPLPQQTKYYAVMTLDVKVFEYFEEILRLCKQHTIDLKLYISPAHANLDGEGIMAAGKWEMMEEWKRKIVTIADRYGVPLWDFSGYNSITTEPVRTPMKYYWDSSHFTEFTSDLILKRIFDTSPSVDEIPLDFGIKLSSSNIKSHLETIRLGRENYVKMNPAELSMLSQNYRAILNGAPLDAKQWEDMFDK